MASNHIKIIEISSTPVINENNRYARNLRAGSQVNQYDVNNITKEEFSLIGPEYQPPNSSIKIIAAKPHPNEPWIKNYYNT